MTAVHKSNGRKRLHPLHYASSARTSGEHVSKAALDPLLWIDKVWCKDTVAQLFVGYRKIHRSSMYVKHLYTNQLRACECNEIRLIHEDPVSVSSGV